MIIVCANIKGGPGKSCLAQNLAVHLQVDHGLKVLLVDGDPQETTADWITSRREAELYQDIRFSKMTGDIRDDLLDQEEHYGAVVVDCGGHDSQTMRSAMTAATHVLVPFRPKRRDLKLLPQMGELAGLIKTVNPDCQFRAVINQARSLPSQVQRAVDAKSICEKFDLPPINTILYDRNIYDDADESGGSIFETGNDQKARSEFAVMASELLGHNSASESQKPNKDTARAVETADAVQEKLL